MKPGIAPQLFQVRDFQCKCGCGAFRVMPGFLPKLSALQEACGVNFVVNSCCRCPRHNKSIGGHYRSLHLTENIAWNLGGSCAVDLALPAGHTHRKLVWDIAWKHGWSIGDNTRFLHLDRRTDYIGLAQAVFNY